MKRIVIFGGGTASRGLTIALCRRNCALTRVVPAWDSGGSSRVLRNALDILPVGDIRQALMTLAHGEGRAGSVVKFFNARLSEDPQSDLRQELAFYADGSNLLLQRMEPRVRRAISDFLAVFRARIGADFDLRRGSIGNFVLAGAYFTCGQDINAAIRAFRELCSISGNVWPSSVHPLDLEAELRDGVLVAGQHAVTALSADQAAVGIRSVRLRRADGHHAPTQANPAVLAAVSEADLLVFGPGSFFTSVLPHLLVPGIANAIRGRGQAIPRVLVANILECPETTGRTVAELVEAFEQSARGATDAQPILSHVLANARGLPFRTVVKGFAYLSTNGADALDTRIFDADIEDPWARGQHDHEALADLLLALP